MMDVKRLTVGSLFDGIGAFSLGLIRSGMELKWTVEIDRACRRVTKTHFPGVKQYKDVKDVGKHNLESVDVVVGGSPCTGFSLAGRRDGMADERSGLFRQMARIVDEIAAKWVVWENVPGCFTTEKGEDFAAVLEAFSGYRPAVPDGGWFNSGFCVGPKRACAWTVLDTQYFGLAQRRKRVFVVCRSGDTAGLDLTQPSREAGRLRGLPFAVLLVGAGLPGDPAPGGKKRKGITRRAAAGAGIQGNAGRGVTQEVAPCLQERDAKGQDSDATKALDNERFGEPTAYTVQATFAEGMGPHASEADVSKCLDQKGGNPDTQQGGTLVCEPIGFYPTGGTHGVSAGEGTSPALKVGSGVGIPSTPAVAFQERNLATPTMTVRRLTVIECERLQGLPDGWTEACGSDSARYRALGNAGGVPCLVYIGLGILGAEYGWMADTDFLAMREAACRANDPVARQMIQDFIEERLGYRPDWKSVDE